MTKKTALLVAYNVMSDMLDYIKETEGREELEGPYAQEIIEAQEIIQEMRRKLV